MEVFQIGILNAETGKTVKTAEADEADALQVAEKVSRWFDSKDTFYSGKPIWASWTLVAVVKCRFQPFIEGKSLIPDVVTESVIVFPKPNARGVEYEFYIQRA